MQNFFLNAEYTCILKKFGVILHVPVLYPSLFSALLFTAQNSAAEIKTDSHVISFHDLADLRDLYFSLSKLDLNLDLNYNDHNMSTSR